MKNPWTKKNPLMSMWLSGASTFANSVRAHATAQAKRQTSALMKKNERQVSDLWASMLTPKLVAKKRRERR